MQNSEKGMPDCRMCDGTGLFYGDADIGPCPCIHDRPVYGYWLHDESECGGIYRTVGEKAEVINGPDMAYEATLEMYREARDNGYEVEWTENEEL